MRETVRRIAGAAAAAVTGYAHADFTGVTVEPFDAGLDDGTTFRIYAHFDHPADQLLAVGGIPGIGVLDFQSPTPLLNDPWDGGASKLEDFPGGGEPWDSWVTIGGPVPFGDTDLTPGICGVIPECWPFIAGDSFHEDDGGWYDSDLSTPETGDSILIAQFSFSDGGPGGAATLSALANWYPAGEPDFMSAPFAVEWQIIPAPGSLAIGCIILVTRSRSRSRSCIHRSACAAEFPMAIELHGPPKSGGMSREPWRTRRISTPPSDSS